MSDPITHCLARLNLEDDIKVKQRTQEFHGQLSSVPAKFFDSGPNLKVVVCIQLAYESLGNLDWDVGLGARLAGCTTSAYEKALSLCRKRLDIRPTVTFEALTIALGSSTMLTPVQELWSYFVQEYPNKFTGIEKRNAIQDLEMAAWKGAAVFCCAKAHGDTLSKDRLHTLCFCTKPELSQRIKIVERNCLAKLNELKIRSHKSLRKTQTRTPRKEAKAEKSTPQPMDVDSTLNGANSQPEAVPSHAVKSSSQQKEAPSHTAVLNSHPKAAPSHAVTSSSQQKETSSLAVKSSSPQKEAPTHTVESNSPQKETSEKQEIPSIQQKRPSTQQKNPTYQQQLPTVKASKPALKRKRSKVDESVDDAPKKQIRTVSGIVSMINQQDYTTTKRFQEFCQWKSSMIDQLKRAS